MGVRCPLVTLPLVVRRKRKDEHFHADGDGGVRCGYFQCPLRSEFQHYARALGSWSESRPSQRSRLPVTCYDLEWFMSGLGAVIFPIRCTLRAAPCLPRILPRRNSIIETRGESVGSCPRRDPTAGRKPSRSMLRRSGIGRGRRRKTIQRSRFHWEKDWARSFCRGSAEKTALSPRPVSFVHPSPCFLPRSCRGRCPHLRCPKLAHDSSLFQPVTCCRDTQAIESRERGKPESGREKGDLTEGSRTCWFSPRCILRVKCHK